jgi:hypothetical protein
MLATHTRAPTGGLSTADIEGIRSSLDAGRRPKVMFTESAGQIAGQVGQVVRLTDPAESDEWLLVRFGQDELPFSPTDLALPPRGRGGRKAVARSAPGPATGTPKPTAARETAPAVPAPRDTAAPAEARRPAKRATRPARPARPKPPAALTVTLAYEAGEWTVAAHQGGKTLAKPYLVRPAEALKMVSMLDVPGVHDAVEQIVTAELTEARRRAEALRSELAEVEARLAELREVG